MNFTFNYKNFDIVVHPATNTEDKISVTKKHDSKYVYVGDPCYVMNERHWSAMCEVMFSSQGEEGRWPTFMDFTIQESAEKLGTYTSGDPRTRYYRITVIGTVHGDGTYKDQQGNRYPVDAGCLAVVPIDYLRDFGRTDMGFMKGQMDLLDNEGVGNTEYSNLDLDAIDFGWHGLPKRNTFNVWTSTNAERYNGSAYAVFGSQRIRIS